MIDQLMRYAKGYMEISICSASYERFLNLCAYHEIVIWDLNYQDSFYEGKIFVRDFRKIMEAARKSHTKIKILKKTGMPFWIKEHKKRTGFFLGTILCLAIIFTLSFFIWDIQIDGNMTQTDEVILDYLEEKEISFGSWKQKINCKELAAELRREFEQFIWVSVQMKGTLLKIQVQENTDEILNTEAVQEPSSLAAAKDGKIVKMITRSGKPLVSVGDTVKKGDVLVLGQLDIKNDAGEVISHQTCAADADILLETTDQYEAEFAMKYRQKVYTGNNKKKCYIQIGDHFFKTPWKGHSYQKYDVIDEKHQMKLWGSFYLPVFWGTYLVREYEIVEKRYTQEEAKERAKKEFMTFSEKIQQKGVQIFKNDVKIVADTSVCRASGTLILHEYAVNRVPLQETLDLEEGIQIE